jgi:hypothetical protein
MNAETLDLSAQLRDQLDASAERMPIELRDQLAAPDRRRADTRTMPVRFRHLIATANSPAHGLSSFFDQYGDTLATRIGAGTHALLFGKPCVPLPAEIKQRRGKAYDAWKDAQDPDALVLTRKEYARANTMAGAVRAHPIANQLLFGPGVVLEQSIEWEQAGRARKTTPDARGPYHVVELKTARCVHPAKFVRDAAFRSYHVQLADQCAAIEALTGKAPSEVYVVAIESVRPYVVQVYQVGEYTIAKGRRIAETWLGRLMRCEASGQWPGYSEQIELLDVPDDGFDQVFFGGEDETSDEDGAE